MNGKDMAEFLNNTTPKVLCKPHFSNPIWKREFATGEHQYIRRCIASFRENLLSNFRYHIKDSIWGRKCVLMSYASCNRSPQHILLPQLPFANDAKPHSHCRTFWATSPWMKPILFCTEAIDCAVYSEYTLQRTL